MVNVALHRRDVLAGATALAVAGGANAQTDARKILRVVPQADPPILDPVFGNSTIALIHGTMIYESLFALDSKLQPHPQMVSTWSVSNDGLTWRFALRDGLKFHDGAPVTTADVIASMQRWMGIDTGGRRIAAVTDKMVPTETNTFEWRLTHPYPNMVLTLASLPARFAAVMRAADLKEPGKPISTAVGSGPFRFVHAERVSGAKIVYEKNHDYIPRSEPPDGLAGGRIVKVDRVEWNIIPDPSTAALALQSGEVDFVEKPSFDLIPTLARNPQIKLRVIVDLASHGMLITNWLYPPFNDMHARQALAYIINQEEALIGGFGEDRQWWRTCHSYFVCGSPYGTSVGTEDFGPNPERAKRLLQESGYKGEKLIFPSTHDISWLGQTAEVLASQMRGAGLNVEILWHDWATTVPIVNKQDPPDKGGWNLFYTAGPGPIMFNPATNLGTDMSCDRKNFIGWPCDETAEKLRQSWVEADEAARPALLDKLHRRLAEVQPYLVVGQSYQPVAHRANLAGVLSSPVITYWNIDKT